MARYLKKIVVSEFRLIKKIPLHIAVLRDF